MDLDTFAPIQSAYRIKVFVTKNQGATRRYWYTSLTLYDTSLITRGFEFKKTRWLQKISKFSVVDLLH